MTHIVLKDPIRKLGNALDGVFEPKRQRTAASGEVLFVSLNGTEMLRAELSDLGESRVVEWVRSKIMTRQIRVVHGCHVVTEDVTFDRLRAGEILNVIHEIHTLPVLVVTSPGCGMTAIHIELEKFRYNGQRLTDLQETLSNLLATGRGSRWELMSGGTCILSSDPVPASTEVDSWVAFWYSGFDIEISVSLEQHLPIVWISYDGCDFMKMDLQQLGTATLRQVFSLVKDGLILQGAPLLGTTDFGLNQYRIEPSGGVRLLGTISQSTASLDSHVFRALRNNELLIVTPSNTQQKRALDNEFTPEAKRRCFSIASGYVANVTDDLALFQFDVKRQRTGTPFLELRAP